MNHEEDDFDALRAHWQSQPLPTVGMEALLAQAARRNRRDLLMRGLECALLAALAGGVAWRWQGFDGASRMLVVMLLAIALAFSLAWLIEAWRRHGQWRDTPVQRLHIAERQARASIGYWRSSAWVALAMLALVALSPLLAGVGLGFDVSIRRALRSVLWSSLALGPWLLFPAWHIRQARQRLARIRALRDSLEYDPP